MIKTVKYCDICGREQHKYYDTYYEMFLPERDWDGNITISLGKERYLSKLSQRDILEIIRNNESKQEVSRLKIDETHMKTIIMFNRTCQRAWWYKKRRVRKKNYARAQYMLRRGILQISRKEWNKIRGQNK